MKKIIALLLALLMTFSVATIAFAEDETASAEDGINISDLDLGEYSWILDLPLWTAKPMLKVAKIALKFVKVYFKLSELVGNIPDGVADEIEKVIGNIIENAQNGNTEEATTAAVVF